MLHLPILRAGVPYQSLTTIPIKDFRARDTVAEVSLANSGLIVRDLARMKENRRVMSKLSVFDYLQICQDAADLFMKGEIPIGDAVQSPQDYIATLSASTGLPEVLCRANMHKLYSNLKNMETILAGLTRNLDLDLLDRGWMESTGHMVSFIPETDVLSAVLPNNSPGVHSLWLPAIPLKIPLALRPGSQEPWTPFRLIQALLRSGAPPEAFGFYPADHAGASELIHRSGRSLIFGDQSTVEKWEGNPRVQVHGPGWSKILIGKDKIDEWPRYIDLISASISENGGRSCLNASGVWVPSQGRAIATAIAKRLASIRATSMDDPQARLAAFSNPDVARRISQMIDAALQVPGAEDISASLREESRLVEFEGAAFLLPTIVFCTDPTHPLAQSEYLFPFAAVVETPQERMVEQIGPTLVATALTDDQDFREALLNAPNVDRLNLGEIATHRISWGQPHEGNLFQFLYRQRALQLASEAS